MESLYRDKTKALINVHDIHLNYGRFRALKNINVTLESSEVHAIVGEHGAGKSSLGLVLSGMLKPHSGRIVVDGKTYRWLTQKIARTLGIEIVCQESSLNEYFTVAENLFFTDHSMNKWFGWNNKKRMLARAKTLFDDYHVDIDPSSPLKRLSLSDRILVNILKHIYPQPKLLILDEVLERLSSASLKKIVSTLMKFKRSGMTILFITRSIDDIYNFADKVSIMKSGELLVTDYVKNIAKINLIKMTYTQIAEEDQVEDLNKEFYQFLRYNEAILRNLPVNLIVTDSENRIKMINDSCKRYFELKRAAYFNRPLKALVSSHNDDMLKFIDAASSFREEKTFYQVPLTLNNIQTISNIKTFPIFDGTSLIGNIITIEDMTEYDRLQKQVMLSEKLASVGLLAAGVAHEINNPLEIIYNSLTYLKYHIHSEELQEAIDDIREGMTSIANIVSNLHSFSDNKQSTNEEIGINTAIQSILNLIRHSTQYKHITIHFEPYQHEIDIRANKNEIKQVILNLLKNSFEAIPTGGEIFIKTTLIHENGTNFLQMTFQDTGPGICDENPDNIFLPFYSTKQDTENNLGLGLSVSYGIITKYHGTITAENIGDSGCQFIIMLPQSLHHV
ncbi:MAG: ATP-binding cassette domain-containing protein [bacterium]|nr:ATP-binding cassette domain-containing protein [bacterium]